MKEPVQIRLVGSLPAIERAKAIVSKAFNDHAVFSLAKRNEKEPGWRLYVNVTVEVGDHLEGQAKVG